MPLSKVFISIVVPTYNDLERLRICLKALEQQTLPRSQYEIIVIDNNSTDSTYTWLNQQTSIVHLQEFKQTSYAARNAGIAAAKGDILAFTDSDCIPAKDWLEKGVSQLCMVSNCGFIGGNIKLFFQNPNRLTPVELYETITALPQKNYIDQQKFAATANMFTFKSVLDKVGGFDSNLTSRGDYEWGRRVYAAGYNIAFAEDVQILHPSRHSFGQIRNKSSRILNGIYELKERNDELSFYVLLKDLILGFRPPIKKISKLTSDQRITKLQDKISLANLVLRLHCNKILVIFKICFKYAWQR